MLLLLVRVRESACVWGKDCFKVGSREVKQVLSQRVIVIGRYIKADKGIADKSCLKIKIF